MQIFVYWNCGGCIMQGHDCGFEEFKDIDEAEAKVKELRKTYSIDDSTIQIIKAYNVTVCECQ